MDVDRCPKQLAPLDREGNEHNGHRGDLRAGDELESGEDERRERVVIRLHAQDVNAAVNQNAGFERFKLSFPEVSVDRVGESRRPGKPPKSYSNTVTLA